MDSATDAINALTENAISFISSLPTTVVALIIVAVIMYLLGVTIRGTIKTIVGAFVMSIVLGAFGVRLPSFSEIFTFLSSMFNHIKMLADAIFG